MDIHTAHRKIADAAINRYNEENSNIRDGPRLASLRRHEADLYIEAASAEHGLKRRAVLLDVAAGHLEKAGDLDRARELQARAEQEQQKYLAERTFREKLGEIGARVMRTLRLR
jgi:hypothetical protein